MFLFGDLHEFLFLLQVLHELFLLQVHDAKSLEGNLLRDTDLVNADVGVKMVK